jgi:hypothetical protein
MAEELSAQVACDRTAFSPAERERRLELLALLRGRVQEVIEVAGGYALRFVPGSEVLRDGAELIALERRCCPFLRFELRLEADGGPLWLEVAGSAAARAILREELGLG